MFTASTYPWSLAHLCELRSEIRNKVKVESYKEERKERDERLGFGNLTDCAKLYLRDMKDTINVIGGGLAGV